ncbi:MAG: transporter substrate-binding domain-containing protein [Bacteroidales bacterium]|nr:transporter substrate-binding domain-containing protein [Bacteroidales bacterium]
MLSFLKSYPKISLVLGISLLIILFFILQNSNKSPENKAISSHDFTAEHQAALVNDNKPKHNSFVLDSIIKRGKLIALTHNNTTGYFIYKGLPMGMHYDMLKTLSKKLNVELEIIVEDDLKTALAILKSGKADLIAMDLTLTKNRSTIVNFTSPIGYNKQVIVQRKKVYGKKAGKTHFLKRALDLNGRQVHVQKGAVFRDELKHIEDITGSNFDIIEDENHTQEELVLMVSSGKIDYTVCDARIAMANQAYMGNLDYSIALTVEQKLCWAVRTDADSLKGYINNWLQKYTRSTKFAVLHNKYFKTKHSSFYTDKKNLPYRGGRLSPFDKTIKKYAKELDWDWRLLASVIYQESRFNPKTVSWAGAQGLMQLMPATGNRFDLKHPFNPEDNIRAGVAFFKWIEKQFDHASMAEEEKIKFMLASYNAGLGHVFDARKLAKKYGKDDNTWTESTDTFMILKANPAYYNDPVVKHGYCRGNEPYKYVRIILERYEDYKNLVKE